MPRRANHEGSITHRADGRWMGRGRLGNGDRVTVYGRNRAEVAGQLRERLQLEAHGLPQPELTETLQSFLATWLESQRSRLRPATWETYERHLRLHVLPTLGRVKLGELRAPAIDRLYQGLLAEGLSTTTVHHVHAILHRAFDQAVRWDYMVRNLADLVDAPAMARTKMRALSAEEARRLLAAAAGDRLEAMVVLAVSSGMRRGELLALRWRDVDLEGSTLSVTGSLGRAHGELQIGEPKTGSSRRSIELTRQAVEALARRRDIQASEREAAGTAWSERDLVFTTLSGTPIEAGNFLRRHYWPMLKRAGLDGVRFHDLRHTAATLMLGRGVHPKVASEMLGHSTVAITLNLYSHVTKTMGREAARAMEELLG